ncbi:DNA primase [Alphaproteobacteria bacterium]|nr:DNA primase [Alphaproteobacteria bacterium]
MKKDLAKLIKDKINIVDVIGREQKLIKSGANYKSLCPFHDEKTPSFTINLQKQNYVCYGCGKSGDVFSYVMDMYKLSFREALEKLATEANINIKGYSFSNNYQQLRQNNSQYHKVLKCIASYYNENLKKYLINNNIKFLEKKNITLDKIEKYNLGLSTNANELEIFLNSKSINTEYLLENNIFKINKFNKKYDLFTNRIIFPILDNFENTIAFGGRCLGQDQPKYINSWENNFFKKREILYNLPSLNRVKSREEEVFVVEGYTDVIAMESLGLKAVAPLGTSLTIEQFRLIWRYLNEPTLLMDGDLAGFKASSRALDIVITELEPEKTLNFIFLKEGKDPDDLVNNNNNNNISLSKVFKNKFSFLKALLVFHGVDDNLSSPERIINFQNKLYQKINNIKNLRMRELYKSFVKRRIDEISKSQIYKFGSASKSIKKDYYFTNLIKNKKPDTFIIRRERSILAAIGLGSVFMHLNAKINWHEEFQKLIKGFDKLKLGSKQKMIIKISSKDS